ncbi:probable inorganic phosphate transporter 1-10 [Dendrobium catenatum]|uniref:H(+)/Pi cotransporter n=1 Tax=Dendrobium catenatum TaxID=906689 RepID=A0A2I0XI65_9ASPA|nr:probable inorganic phosphate transporter 1-10 [Dendrobium catenatum]PKU87601.1 putative inorganic phosphate transporter 1-10 [Dendrobium catenatum]
MKLKVLTALDHAKTQLYHFKAIIIAGMGLFTDAYDLFTITPVLKLIGRIYYHSNKGGTTPPIIYTAVISVALIGMILGQLLFGFLGDRLGRRRVYGLALLLMIFSSFGSGFSVCRTRGCVLTSLCFFRFLLGVGIGGDYPLSATIMSEFANRRTRGSFIAAVFSMQGFGILVGSAVTMAAAAAFERVDKKVKMRGLIDTPEGADMLWRVILMMGAVPAVFTLYWRMAMPETARYTALVEQNVVRANHDIRRVLVDLDLPSIDEDTELGAPTRPLSEPYGFFSKQFLQIHGRNLFACAAAWFIIDIPYYGSTLFQSKIYEPWFKDPKLYNAYREAYNVAKFQAIIAAASTIPGYWFTVLTIDRIGRRPIQIMGFILMAVFLFSLAGPYDAYWNDHIKNAWFLVLYGFTFFFSNFGPNTTTFIVPAELFPARFRCSCHGIAGAAGKVGAIIGSVGFLWASRNEKKDSLGRGWKPGIGMMHSLLILGGCCLLGAFITYFFIPETKLTSLEDNEGSGSREEDELQRTGPVSTNHSSILPLNHASPSV